MIGNSKGQIACLSILLIPIIFPTLYRPRHMFAYGTHGPGIHGKIREIRACITYDTHMRRVEILRETSFILIYIAALRTRRLSSVRGNIRSAGINHPRFASRPPCNFTISLRSPKCYFSNCSCDFRAARIRANISNVSRSASLSHKLKVPSPPLFA